MPTLIDRHGVRADDWRLLEGPAEEASPDDALLVPLQDWLAQADALRRATTVAWECCLTRPTTRLRSPATSTHWSWWPSPSPPSPTAAAIRSRGCCASASAGRGSCARSAMCCATSSST
jgi:hypothetical protein